MNYDLARLSSRSFEQLIQALSVRYFGPGVVVFGDGPDGGREATIQGQLQYAPHGQAWDGLCIIQAKFRQRPADTRKDGNWAANQLKKELERFQVPTANVDIPDYYVFATNVVLSPASGGAKDKISEQLGKAKDDWGLRDFDIWDYDKLSTWLNCDSEIRTRFGWTTAGDVLGEMLGQLKGSTPTFEATMINYLEKTLISDRYVRLEEAGHAAETPTPLSNVFVDLPLEGARDGVYFMRALLDQTATLRNLDEPESRQGRMVLVGGPGQGKTTLGQFACQVFRASLLSHRPVATLSAEGRNAVKAIEVASHEAGLPFGRVPRYPIRIVLTDLAKVVADEPISLLAYIGRIISEKVGTEISLSLLRQWLGAYPWMMVLDGLDEVPASAGREAVVNSVSEFWVDVAQVNSDIFVLATTRPQGYNNDFSPHYYQHLCLAELDAAQALDYGHKLADARYSGDAERATLVKDRLTKAAEDSTTEHLMRSPLQVAIMTALVVRYGQPPRERWSLFNAYYEVIYQRERERDTDAATVLREYRPDIDAIHQQVGLALQLLTTNSGHADPHLTAAQLEQVIDARLKAEGHGDSGTAQIASAIRSAAELRLVFLVGAQANKIGFEIRSLQEFMAAGALVDGMDGKVVERLAAIAPLPAWRNVFLFAAGECFVARQYLRPRIHALCRELDADVNRPLLAATQAGARLALDLLEDRTARRQPGQHRVIAKHALETLSIPGENIARRLAACYDPSLDDLYKSVLGDAVEDGDDIASTVATLCAMDLTLRGITWASDICSRGIARSYHSSHPMAVAPREMAEEAFRQYGDTLWESCQLGDLRRIARFSSRPSGFLRMVAPWHDRDDHIQFAHDDNLTLHVRSVRRKGNESAVSPRADCSPTLAVLQAASRFENSPTVDALADSLEAIETTSSPEIWRSYAADAPWPMAMCLRSAGSIDELRKQIEQVREGLMGDYEQWLEAEETWTAADRTLAEKVDHTHPLDLLGVAGATLTQMPSAGIPFSREFRRLRAQGSPSSVVLASIIVWALGGNSAASGNRPDADDVVNLCSWLSQHTDSLEQLGRQFTYTGLGLFGVADQTSAAISAVAKSLPSRLRFTYRQDPNLPAGPALSFMLQEAMMTCPSQATLEALAVALISREDAVVHPISIEELTHDEITDGVCAFIEFVSGASHNPTQCGERFGIRLDHWTTWLHSPRLKDAPGIDPFLEGVRITAPRRWEPMIELNQAMNGIVAKAVAPIAERPQWDSLELPRPHPSELADS